MLPNIQGIISLNCAVVSKITFTRVTMTVQNRNMQLDQLFTSHRVNRKSANKQLNVRYKTFYSTTEYIYQEPGEPQESGAIPGE